MTNFFITFFKVTPSNLINLVTFKKKNNNLPKKELNSINWKTSPKLATVEFIH